MDTGSLSRDSGHVPSGSCSYSMPCFQVKLAGIIDGMDADGKKSTEESEYGNLHLQRSNPLATVLGYILEQALPRVWFCFRTPGCPLASACTPACPHSRNSFEWPWHLCSTTSKAPWGLILIWLSLLQSTCKSDFWRAFYPCCFLGRGCRKTCCPRLP